MAVHLSSCGLHPMFDVLVNTVKLLAVSTVMVAALLLVNIALLLNGLTLLFSRHLFQQLGASIPQVWCCFCLFCLKKYLNFSFTCDTPDLSRIARALVAGNHQSMLDIAVLYCLADKFGKGRHPRWLGKNALKYTPLLGWGALLSGTMIFLRRDWARDREGLQASLCTLVKAQHPFWLCIFPEGTRLTPAKREASQHYARSKNYPVLHKVLLPRPKGFTAAVQGLRADIDAVLDVSICYSQRPPFIASVVRGERIAIVVHARILPPTSLPRDAVGLKRHLFDIYRHKDKYLRAQEKSA